MTRRGTSRHVLLSATDFRQVIAQERAKAAEQLTLFVIDDYAGRVVYVDDAIKFTGVGADVPEVTR